MKPILHPSGIVLLAPIALALAARGGGGGDDGDGPAMGTSPAACQAAPAKCA